jgi:hypothetical protein
LVWVRLLLVPKASLAIQPSGKRESTNMAKAKWSPSNLLALAIARLEEQTESGSLSKYGTNEHLAIARYLAHEACREAGCELSPDQKSAIRKAFGAEETFLGYASNAKKLLIEAGTLGKDSTPDSGYE